MIDHIGLRTARLETSKQFMNWPHMTGYLHDGNRATARVVSGGVNGLHVLDFGQ